MEDEVLSQRVCSSTISQSMIAVRSAQERTRKDSIRGSIWKSPYPASQLAKAYPSTVPFPYQPWLNNYNHGATISHGGKKEPASNRLPSNVHIAPECNDYRINRSVFDSFFQLFQRYQHASFSVEFFYYSS